MSKVEMIKCDECGKLGEPCFLNWFNEPKGWKRITKDFHRCPECQALLEELREKRKEQV